ncbi:hypothetical protein N9R45_03125 [Flavobacteriaceae bacterium]|jgi:hypothetical protein|nr:hypothetical protein [Flavobacteriaceae bacterium]
MKKPLYLIASIITILLISERALNIIFDIGPFSSKPIRILFLITALILFSIHFYKKPKNN